MSKQKGFTLIELMVAVAILAIVLSIAIPSFSTILLNNRISTTADELHTAVQLARSEAIKRKKTVTLCRANADFSACVQGGIGSTDWASGWLLTSGTDVLKVWELGQGLKVTGPSKNIDFLGSGMIREPHALSVKEQGCSSGPQYKLDINKIGWVSLEKSSC
ncbi:MAG TPA: GspH/FimT family pseudopilin [Thiopseudomonas sp.]|nr:GspH/FimT family pseudopilin [Thiopseudomonas sp.]